MVRYSIALATCILILAVGFEAIVPPQLPPPVRVAGNLPQTAYVWQRRWTAHTAAAVETAPPAVGDYLILAVEIETVNRRLTTHWAQYDATALRAAGRPVGLTIRMGPWFGDMVIDGAAFEALRAAAVQAAKRAHAAGLYPTEIQIDFDCASLRLIEYAGWLQALKKALPGERITFTALPCWLDGAAFGRLCAAADGYVLQVHCLPRPASINQPRTLCGLAQARQAVEQAARFGQPFRVALPTYGYLLSFDAAGQYLGLAAEGDLRVTPAGGHVVALDSDPATMCDLIAGWQQDRPAALTGVVWFRLPTAADRRCWPAATFAAVSAGHRPASMLRVRLQPVASGLFDLLLENTGTADATCAPVVQIRWAVGPSEAGSSNGLQAADAINGWRLIDRLNAAGQTGCQFLPPPAHTGNRPPFRLRPNTACTLGWLRLTEPTVVPEVTIVEEVAVE